MQYVVARLMISVVLFSLMSLVQAQNTDGVNYQAVFRDNSGVVIANQNISVRVNIRQGSLNGPTIYSETHSKTTSQFGLFDLIIGDGINPTTNFDAIDWADGPHFIQPQITYNSVTYTLPTTQFQSVPYALYAEKAGSVGNGVGNEPLYLHHDTGQRSSTGWQTITNYNGGPGVLRTVYWVNFNNSVWSRVRITIDNQTPMTVDENNAPTAIRSPIILNQAFSQSLKVEFYVSASTTMGSVKTDAIYSTYNP